MVLGAAGAIGFGTIAPAGAAWIPADPAPIVRTRAQENQPAETDGERPVEPVILWSLSGIAAGAVVLGTLYLFKRKIGAFPENPAWVAPITIMPSRENADDATFGGTADAHGHGDPHGAQH